MPCREMLIKSSAIEMISAEVQAIKNVERYGKDKEDNSEERKTEFIPV